MQLQALLFDVDGTLAETEEAHRLAFNDAFRESGLDWEWSQADYERLLGTAGGKARILRHMGDIGFAPDGEDADPFAKRIHVRKTELFGERLRTGMVPLRPGVERLIHEAHASGLRLAIATTTSPGNVETLFEATVGRAVLDLFEVLGVGPCVENLKPSPEIYVWVMEQLGLPPAACLALEDSKNGVLAARAAGLPVVVTQATYTRHDDVSGALAVISDLGEPGRPFTLIGGDSFGKGVVDVDLLRRWHGKGQA